MLYASGRFKLTTPSQCVGKQVSCHMASHVSAACNQPYVPFTYESCRTFSRTTGKLPTPPHFITYRSRKPSHRRRLPLRHRCSRRGPRCACGFQEACQVNTGFGGLDTAISPAHTRTPSGVFQHLHAHVQPSQDLFPLLLGRALVDLSSLDGKLWFGPGRVLRLGHIHHHDCAQVYHKQVNGFVADQPMSSPPLHPSHHPPLGLMMASLKSSNSSFQ
ncbi:hypothetical protein LZ30DRAFT_226204 [Colletotrichum cereale]|nr:hypothetical protein LZ30DRAFT_226204 [Colletotrichum cereale]